MSLRRSARISTSSVAAAPEEKKASAKAAKEEPAPNSKNNASEPKKRKSRPSTSTAAPNNTNTNTDTKTTITTLPPPTTPLPKRRKQTTEPQAPPANPPPSTPTPSTIALMTSTTSTSQPRPLTQALPPRPANPHATNAPLATPNGSRVTAYPPSSPSTLHLLNPPENPSSQPTPSPSKKRAQPPPDVGSAVRPASSTTETLLADAEAHLCKVDARLGPLVAKHRCEVFSPEGLREVVEPFAALGRGIIGQQVSGQAADSIRKKFTALFPETHPAFPTPAQVLTKDIPTLRTAGLSQRKAEYIHGLAEKFASGEFTAQMLIEASDEDLIEKLVAVRGLGRWSVEMFACFGLKRMDVFSTGDLGVQRGMATYMGRDTAKLKGKGGKWKYMSEAEMLSIASKFSPYRSLFMWYMWRIADVDISVMKSE